MKGFAKTHGLTVITDIPGYEEAQSNEPSNRMSVTPLTDQEIVGAYGNRVVPVFYDQHDPSRDLDPNYDEPHPLTADFPRN